MRVVVNLQELYQEPGEEARCALSLHMRRNLHALTRS